jgi:uncharacterized protein YwgA
MVRICDRINYVYTVLKRANPNFKLTSSMDVKLLFHKYVFIIQKMGIDIDYTFNQYLKGAFSPFLHLDYLHCYDKVNGDYKLTEKDIEIIEKMKKVIELTPDQLEILTFILMQNWLCDNDVLINTRFYKDNFGLIDTEKAIKVGREIFKCNS